MNCIDVVHCYPTNKLYGANGVGYTCFSFIGRKEGEELDLYRLVIRVSDQAYQIFKATEVYGERLYADVQAAIPTDVFISLDAWKGSARKHGRHSRSLSVDSIGLRRQGAPKA